MAQMVKQYLHTAELCSLNLVIGNFINFIATTKIKKKETYEGPFIKILIEFIILW